MVQFDLWPWSPPSRAYPWGFAIFFFLVGLFLTPELLIYLKCFFMSSSFWSVQKQNETFSQLLETFSRGYWEKDDGCHNVVKTWRIHLKMKTKNKNSLKKRLLCRTLHKDTESLDWIFVYLYASKTLYLFSYNLSLYIKVRLDKYFSPSFAKK